MRNTILIGVLFVMAGIAATATIHIKKCARPPRDVEEAAERMRDLGLHIVVRGAATGSREPITHDDATNLHFGSDWTGKVRAWPGFYEIPDRPNTKTVAWGSVLLTGDPDNVDRLVPPSRRGSGTHLVPSYCVAELYAPLLGQRQFAFEHFADRALP